MKRRRRTRVKARTTVPNETAVQQTRQPDHARTDEDIRQERKRALIFVGVLVLMVLGSIVYASVTEEGSTSTDDGVTATLGEVMTFKDRGNGHTHDDVMYPDRPPVGGPHDDIWQNCGFYAAPVIEEQAVHSLEHGAVWITYRPDLDASQISALEALAEQQEHILISPFPGLDAPVVASAWNYQLHLESAIDSHLTDFIRTFRLSSSAPEAGAPCSGGSSSSVEAD